MLVNLGWERWFVVLYVDVECDFLLFNFCCQTSESA
jgi:hypothetical protein